MCEPAPYDYLIAQRPMFGLGDWRGYVARQGMAAEMDVGDAAEAKRVGHLRIGLHHFRRSHAMAGVMGDLTADQSAPNRAGARLRRSGGQPCCANAVMARIGHVPKAADTDVKVAMGEIRCSVSAVDIAEVQNHHWHRLRTVMVKNVAPPRAHAINDNEISFIRSPPFAMGDGARGDTEPLKPEGRGPQRLFVDAPDQERIHDQDDRMQKPARCFTLESAVVQLVVVASAAVVGLMPPPVTFQAKPRTDRL